MSKSSEASGPKKKSTGDFQRSLAAGIEWQAWLGNRPPEAGHRLSDPSQTAGRVKASRGLVPRDSWGCRVVCLKPRTSAPISAPTCSLVTVTQEGKIKDTRSPGLSPRLPKCERGPVLPAHTKRETLQMHWGDGACSSFHTRSYVRTKLRRLPSGSV